MLKRHRENREPFLVPNLRRKNILPFSVTIAVVFLLSVTKSCLSLYHPMDCNTSGFSVLHYLPEFSWIHVHHESVISSNHLILYPPVLLLTPIFPSIRVLSNESVLHIRWPGIGVSASALVLPVNIQYWFPLGCAGWISWQSNDSQESSSTPQPKALILQHSVFFMVQHSQPYLTTGKSIALTRQTFVGNVSAF